MVRVFVSRSAPRRGEGRQQVLGALKHSERFDTRDPLKHELCGNIRVLFGCIHGCKTISNTKWPF